MINPILERELKTRMRTWKTPILLAVYLLLMGLVVGLFFLGSGILGSFYYEFNPRVIGQIYDTVAIFQLVILMCILPVFTATSISGERERQTLDLLLCTDISPWKIIAGKIGAALAFVFLVIFTTIPYMGITFLFGGISLWDIIKIILFYMVTAIMVCSIGMFTTTHFKKNITSIIMSYVILGITVIAPLVFLFIAAIVAQMIRTNNPTFTFFEDYTYEIFNFVFASNPFYGISSLLNNDVFNFRDRIGLGKNALTFLGHITPWMASTIYYIIFSTGALLLAKKRLKRLK